MGIECPYKDQTNLNFCTKCGVGDHSLEDCPIMLEKIMAKRNVIPLSRVHKNYLVNTRNLHIVTRQGTKISEDELKNNDTMLKNYVYSDPNMQNKTFNDATQVFKNLDI